MVGSPNKKFQSILMNSAPPLPPVKHPASAPRIPQIRMIDE